MGCALFLLGHTEGNPPGQGLHDCATLNKCLTLGLDLVDSKIKRSHASCLSMLPIAGKTEEIAAKDEEAAALSSKLKGEFEKSHSQAKAAEEKLSKDLVKVTSTWQNSKQV